MKALFVAALFVSLSLSAAARAQPAGHRIGTATEVVVSADRLFGVHWTRLTLGDPDSGTYARSSRFEFGNWGTANPTAIPRVAADVVLAGGFSAGAALGFRFGSGTTSATSKGTTVETDAPSATDFLLAPRLGYVMPVSDALALWLRGGITWHQSADTSTSADGKTTSTSSHSGLALTLDPAAVFTPWAHAGIAVGPTVELPLGGTLRTETTKDGTTTSSETDSRRLGLGVVAAVFARY